MGRIRTPEDQRPVHLTVRLSPRAFDVAYRYASRRHLTVNAVLKRTLEHVFTHPRIADQKSPTRAESCYGGSAASSTLASLLGASAESPS